MQDGITTWGREGSEQTWGQGRSGGGEVKDPRG